MNDSTRMVSDLYISYLILAIRFVQGAIPINGSNKSITIIYNR